MARWSVFGQRSQEEDANLAGSLLNASMTLALLIALASSLVAMGLIVRRLDQG
ncbi:MAG: hypothetical protein VKK03_00040 [Synechococcus sp.]|nr:hypothetical protein [Synechococcus sp.]